MSNSEQFNIGGAAVRWLRNGNRRCVFVFSSFALRDYGAEAFSFRKYFEEHLNEVDVVLIKDAANQWYNRKLDGLGNSPDETTRALASVASHYEHVSSFGSSMGAYASLLYGSRLGLNHVLAVSPQTFLAAPFPRFYADRHRGSFVDLRKTIVDEVAPKWGAMDVVVGEESLFDIYQALPLIDRPGINFCIVPGEYHVVANYWSDIGLFPSIVESLCKGKASEMIRELSVRYAQGSRVYSHVRRPGFSSLLTQAVEAYYHERYPSAIEALTSLLAEVPGWLGATAMLADSELRVGDTKAAIEHFTVVAQSSKTIDDFYPEYAGALARTGQTKKAIDAAARGALLNRSMRRGFGVIAEIFETQGLMEEARQCRQREKL